MNAAPAASPRFFWQGVLIVLPVAVLAVFALFSLRQDITMVDHEAREKAQVEADEIAEHLWATFDDPGLRAAFEGWHRSRWTLRQADEPGKIALQSAFLFQIDSAGQLVFPPPPLELPEPRPLDPADLNEEQANRWLAAQSTVPDSRTNLADVVESLRQFIALAPPDRFAAAARFQLGGLLGRNNQPETAAHEFQALANLFPESSGESGLPLPPLALLKAAEQLLLVTNAGAPSASALLDAACSNAVAVPSSITPYFLHAAFPLDSALSTNLVARWQALWNKYRTEYQTARTLHAAAQPAFIAAMANAVRRRTEDRARTIPFPYPVPPQTKEAPPRLFWFAMPKEFLIENAKEGRPSGIAEFYLASWIDTDNNGDWYLCRPRFGQFLGSRSTSLIGGGRERGLNRNLLSLTFGAETNLVNRGRESAPAEYPFFDPFLAELEKQRARLPNYFSLSLELAGRDLISTNALPPFYASGGKGRGRYYQKADAGIPPPLLASASHVENGIEFLRVGIHLIRPDLLYARQHTRTRLFGLLIGASSLAAVIGFASARHAFRRQQQLAEMKSNFVSSVSHELRAPIASVRLMAESLDRGTISEPGKQREYFRFIVQECRRLGTLIENVLDFARIEQGRKQYGFEPTDLAALVRQTVQLMAPAATEREVTLRFNDSAPPAPQRPVSAGVSPVGGSEPRQQDAGAPGRDPAHLQPSLDGAALQQALVNLLDNAIKHSPPRSVVTVGLESIPHPPSLLLSVQDHGPGIPVEEHEKIFERFYRCGPELRRETQGVGIGLSIVKHVAEAHGGHVRVESEIGKGSRFVIELPTNSHQPKK